MSDTPQGPGWWKASDDKWYPPEQHPDHAATEAGTDATPTSGSVPPAPESPAGAAVTPDASPPPAAAPPTPPPAAAPPAGPPPGGTPPGSPSAASASQGGGKGKIIVGIVAVIALIAAGFVLVSTLSGDKASAEEVSLFPIGHTAANSFSGSIAPEPVGSLRAFAERGAPEATAEDEEGDEDGDPDSETSPSDASETRKAGYRQLTGNVPGLYGGSLDETSCDVDQLTAFLAVEDEKAQAFAEVLVIDQADIGAYLDSLTAVNLGSDTRVLNHGFVDGEAVASEAILQRGSAVLVDTRGVPRVNCYGGNPLLPPSLDDGESFSGDKWDSFEPDDVVVVEEAPADLDAFELVDVETGNRFQRPAGKKQGADRPAETARPIDGPIDLDKVYPDRLEDDRTEARYTFEAPDSAVLTVKVENTRTSSSRISVGLYSEGSRIFSDYVAPGSDFTQEVVLDHEGSAEFELLFGDGPAVFEFEVAHEIQSDAGQKGDAGSDFDTAFEISSGETVEGFQGGRDTADVYLLELEPGADLQLESELARNASSRIYVAVYFEGSRLYGEYVNPGGSADWKSLFSSDDRGPVEIHITEGSGEYTFTATLVPQTDGGEDGDAGDSLAEARTITTGEELTGQVGDRDKDDWYLFEVPAPDMVLEVSIAATSSSRAWFGVEDSSGSRVLGEYVNPGSKGEFTFSGEPGEQFRMRVTEGRADYTFTLRAAG